MIGLGPWYRENVTVIGAGMVGASVAFHMAARGARVTVLDAGEPGEGTSRVSFAWANARDKSPQWYHDLNRRSLDMWDRFVRRIGSPDALTHGGEARWAATEDGAEEMRRRVAELQSWGYPIRLISPEEFRSLEPEIDPGDVTAASYTDIDCHVDTGAVVDACLGKAREMGAEIITGCEVTGFHTRRSDGKDCVEGVIAGGQEIECDAVVLANGTAATPLAAELGLGLPQQHSPGATVVTDPLPPIFRNVAAVHTPRDLPAELLMNFRQLRDGRVMIHGGTHDGSIGDDSREDAERLVMDAARFIPALRKTSISEIRTGWRPMPEDGFPVLGFAEAVPNAYFAVMHSGVTLAPFVGEMAAIEVLDGARVQMLDNCRIERFQG